MSVHEGIQVTLTCVCNKCNKLKKVSGISRDLAQHFIEKEYGWSVDALHSKALCDECSKKLYIGIDHKITEIPF